MNLYFVETTVAEQRETLCRWTERFYDEKRKVQIIVDSTQAAQFIDQMLWSFSQGSFIPHLIFSPATGSHPMESVLLVIGEHRIAGFDTVLCDAFASLEFMQQFETVVHFILRDDQEKCQESRVLWQKVRDLGLQPVHVPYGRQP